MDTPTEQGYDRIFYQKRVQEFAQTLSVTTLLPHHQDPLCAYLIEVGSTPTLRDAIIKGKEGQRVFIDTMMDFVTSYLQKANYYRRRWGAEAHELQEATLWSDDKILLSWRTLLSTLEERFGVQGWVSKFYTHEFSHININDVGTVWQSLLQEWQRHFQLRITLQKQQFIKDRGPMQLQLILNNLLGVRRYLTNHPIKDMDFQQTWALMGGRWNSLVFERLYRTTSLQHRYPVLKSIVDRMGRKADKDGRQHIATTSGRSEQIEHTSKSDIVGISMGRDLGSLLPTEMALFMDDKTETVFLHKYITHRLQVFDHQSRSGHTARNLHFQSARQLGPLIVCVDTSGSMSGEPCQIALSLMMRLAEMSEHDHRRCFLIAFSVYAKSIDVLLDRTQLLKFFTQPASGDTDAQRMLNTTFDLLRTNPHYACADILWITDFRIPIPPASYIQEMQQLRRAGTHFFGLQIGEADNRWLPLFDEMFYITDIHFNLSFG